ncbi:hypothetical protein TWF730_007419 [Orbilia blumenaviensis]|uniref:Uncharacterized protein n=1 Tax=Orbilia blumenaviensis TaxID=1796055 RepID=A0AAV9VAG5_9PEZI
MNDHADALQFFVWVRRYGRKFETSLTSAEKSLSPPWEEVSPVMNFDSNSRTSVDLASSKNSSKTDLSEVGFGGDIILEPFTIQPFRAEVDRVCSLYLVPNSPLFLPLTAKEKSATLAALNRTTHPSAFIPATISIELSLRSTAHPSFIRHSLSNATHTRLSFISVIAIALVVISIFTLIFLTLSGLSRWYRLLTYIFLFPGLNIIANARRGLCLLLVVLGMARNLSPWEVYAVDDRESFELAGGVKVVDEDGGKGGSMIGVNSLDLNAEMQEKRKDEETRVRWFIKEYDNRPILSRVFEKRVTIKDPEIRHLQLKRYYFVQYSDSNRGYFCGLTKRPFVLAQNIHTVISNTWERCATITPTPNVGAGRVDTEFEPLGPTYGGNLKSYASQSASGDVAGMTAYPLIMAIYSTQTT